MSSLSRAEARERSALLVVRRYDVDVDLTGLLQGSDMACRSTVTFTGRRPGAGTFVDCCAEVRSATLNGRPLPSAVDGRIALDDLADENVLVVESVQSDTANGPGAHKAVDLADGLVYVWTTFQPDESRYAWACFDQPDLKAPWTLTVDAPVGWTVLSNAEDVVVTETGAGVRRWSFAPTPPLSSYLPMVLAGPFHEIRRHAGGYDLGLFARRSFRDRLERDADELFTLTAQGLDFFGHTFGSTFPQWSYDQVFLPEFGGAMENYRCVAWGDHYLTAGPPTPAERQQRALYLLHELAHMWFGDIVTMRWWDDLWLNEAFAQFAAMWAAERATAFGDMWAGHTVTAKLRAYRADQSPATSAVAQRSETVAAHTPSYALTYGKGASILRQLMAYLGEEPFRSGLRAYLADHAWGNATMADFTTALSAASGRDVRGWCRDWLETTGPDQLIFDEQDGRLVIHATGPGGRPVRPQVVSVGAYRRGAGELAEVASVEVAVDGPETAVDLPVGYDLYLLNHRDLAYATTRPAPAGRDEASRLPTPQARAVAVATAYDMLLAGATETAAVVDSLCLVIERETSPALQDSYLRLAAELVEQWAPDRLRESLSRQVASVCEPLATEGLQARRVLAATAGEDLERLEATWPGDLDLRWRVLRRRAELSQLRPGDLADLVARDRDPEAWISALAVRACSPEAADKAAVWRLLAEERTVPLAHAEGVAGAFWRPGQDGVLAAYAERYLELLPSLHGGDAVGYSRLLFPLRGVSADFPDRAAAVAETTAAGVRSGAVERGDLVRRMLRARAA